MLGFLAGIIYLMTPVDPYLLLSSNRKRLIDKRRDGIMLVNLGGNIRPFSKVERGDWM